ncbi:flavodoxin family protein [Nocardioides lianchengensis]|uniref:Uncharacterized protein n=1 Tax=Nocardioides lianchengensis TaxID=1045774 RepID=A0A1G6YJX8_9ACTN|nr:hypothetical protein [Nocardioides lianchengensis]NYG09616.1 hypothetical protein [Nocardioides lianchengensis]SDD90709.1 hypothetical protein SAMN05421872_11278 [Nocardioides lianchengensis]
MSTPAGRALVARESLFGNTARLATAVACGLTRSGLEVDTVDVGAESEGRPPMPVASYDLLVVGSPTHAFTLSRASTRAEAVEQGAPAERAGRGMREWLAELPAEVSGQRAAAFDTRLAHLQHLPGSASAKATRVLRRHGYRTDEPISFYVTDGVGPLLEDELARAETWGAYLGIRLRSDAVAS